MAISRILAEIIGVSGAAQFVRIPLNDGYFTELDLQDVDLAFKQWSVYHRSETLKYVQRNEKPKLILLHRLVMERIIGRPLNREEIVDHIDGNALNNKRKNLRLATHAENMRNRKLRKDSTTGFKGVQKTNNRKWRAYITVNNKTKHLGIFDTPEEAYSAYCEAAIKLHGEFARFN